MLIVSGSIQNIPFLKSGSLSLIDDKSAKSKCAGYFPLLVILNVVELTFLISASVLLSGFLPINNGPNSKVFSAVMYTFDK